MIDLRSPKTRQVALIVFTGLVVTFVRHGLEKHWRPFESAEQFLIGWMIHSIAAFLLSAIAAIVIARSNRFFTGHQEVPELEDLVTYALLTILVGAIAILIVANWPERDEDASLCLQPLGYSMVA